MQWETLSAALAHELRNPLAGIVAHVDLLLEMIDPHDPRRSSLTAIEAETRRMEATLAALLEFGRRGQAQRRPTDPEALIRGVFDRWRERAALAGVRLEIDVAGGLGEILGDRVLLERLLENLVENALRAVEPRRGRVRLGARRHGGCLELTCADDGGGIAAEDLGRIFEPFFTRSCRGIGLGLALARRIAEEHGGTLAVASAPGRGSTFTLRLPVGRAGAGRQAGHGAAAAR